jgi:hypothetical protein
MRCRLFGALFVLQVAGGCGGAPQSDDTLATILLLTADPQDIPTDGTTSVIHIVGIADGGGPGQCDVSVAASIGSLNGSFRPVQVSLDALGSAQVSFACDQSTEPSCQPPPFNLSTSTITAECASRSVGIVNVTLDPPDTGCCDAGSGADGGTSPDAGGSPDGGGVGDGG